MKEFLYQPEIYGQINIDLISKFKSGYGLALYENCIRYKGLSQTPWFPIDVFRKLMGVFEEKYLAFKDFKKRVLDIGIEEVNAVSPLRIIPELDRVNQKVIRVRFKLEKNIDTSPALINELSDGDELKQMLFNIFGLSEQMIAEAYEKYDVSYIKEKVEMISQSENFISGKIRGLAGYLIEALKKDYKASKSSKALISERRKQREEQEKEQKEKEEKQSDRYKQYVNKKIASYLSSLTKEQESELMNGFAQSIKSQSSILNSWYQKHGLEHPATKASFHQYIKENKANEIGAIISMEEYLELLG